MLRDCVDYIKHQGLNSDVYMMYLFPGQTEEELKQDTTRVENLSDSTNITWRSLMHFPGTIYYDWAIKNKKFSEEEYKRDLEKGYSFYQVNEKYNFSQIKNPPKL